MLEEHKHKISLANKGRVFSVEHRKKLSDARMGLPAPSHKEGCQCFRCSKIRSVHKDGCSCCCCRKTGHKFTREETGGANNVNWKGGISTEREKIRGTSAHRSFVKNVMVRDNFTCCLCHNVGGKLNAHHIKKFSEYPDLRFDTDNGITLCEECHKLVHSKDSHFVNTALLN